MGKDDEFVDRQHLRSYSGVEARGVDHRLVTEAAKRVAQRLAPSGETRPDDGFESTPVRGVEHGARPGPQPHHRGFDARCGRERAGADPEHPLHLAVELHHDTSRPGFSFAQLFRENRFTGADKLGDTDRMTLALSSRLLDERSREIVRASVGQIRYFRNRKVALDGGEPEETARASDVVAEIEARPRQHWRLRAGLQYDTGADRTERSVWNVRYRPDRRTVVNAGYRLVRDVDPSRAVEQADLSFAWPFGASWRIVGRWNFALNEGGNKTLEALGGLEYESCCWGFRFVARRFLGGGEDDYSNGLFLQIELKGLTGVGRRTEALLTRSIPGYEDEF